MQAQGRRRRARTPTSWLLTMLALVATSAGAQGFDRSYEARSGDLNEDGLEDIFVAAPSNFLLGRQQGKEAFIELPPSVGPFVLLQGPDAEYTVVTELAPADWQRIRGWPRSDVVLTPTEVNADGRPDLLLSQLPSLPAGVSGLIVYAPDGPGAAPTVVREMDDHLLQFFREFLEWFIRPSHFDDTVPYRTETITSTAWTYLGFLPYYSFPANCRGFDRCWYLVDDPGDPGGHDPDDNPAVANVFHYWGSNEVRETVQTADYSVFTPEALAIAGAFGAAGAVPLDSTPARTVLDTLSNVLGVPYGPAIGDLPLEHFAGIGVILVPETTAALLSLLRTFILSTIIAEVLDQSLDRDWLYHYSSFCEEIRESGVIGLVADSDVFLSPDVYFTADKARKLLSLPRLPECLFIVDKGFVNGLVGPQTVAPNYGQPGGGTEYVGLAPVIPESREPVPLAAH